MGPDIDFGLNYKLTDSEKSSGAFFVRQTFQVMLAFFNFSVLFSLQKFGESSGFNTSAIFTSSNNRLTRGLFSIKYFHLLNPLDFSVDFTRIGEKLGILNVDTFLNYSGKLQRVKK